MTSGKALGAAGAGRSLEVATIAYNYKGMVFLANRDALRANRTHAGF
jgi:hypothetical protein